jgi:Tfp pilus assembly protein PilX
MIALPPLEGDWDRIGNPTALFLMPWKRSSNIRSRRSGVALVITLALLSVLVLILVAFVSMAQLDHTATASYSESMSADQIAHASLNLVQAQLQMEMSKDALPDTTTGGSFANSPVYTNVTSANIEPQANVTNANFPTLVKMSTNSTPFFTGTQITSQLQASSAITTTPSQNGRSVSPTRWGQSYFGTGGALFSNAQAPYWVIMTRSGATNAAGLGFGSTGNTINNASSANTNYAIGRFAYAIYNEGGLLDVTAAGSPFAVGSSPALTAPQQDQIKGMLAGADFTLASWNGAVTNSTLTAWRNPATGSGASTTVYLSQ